MDTLDECAAVALGSLDAAVRRRFAADPLRTMREDVALQVRAVGSLTERRAGGGACDGLSFLKDGVVLYSPTDRSRRENFTLAHELGHWLVAKFPAMFDWAADQQSPQIALESLCDRIAQGLLLSDDTVTEVVAGGPVRAQHVLDLYNVSQASLPACAVAVAAGLPGLGAVVVVDRDPDGDGQSVSYASVRPDTHLGWPRVHPWPGQPVPPGHPLRSVRPGAPVQRRSSWATPWGATAEFYLDAVAVSHRRTVGVLADTDLWGTTRFHPNPRRDYDQRPEQTITCCGRPRTARGYPCQECGQVPCPACGRCRCDRHNDELVPCTGRCFLSYRPHLLVDGLCEDCR